MYLAEDRILCFEVLARKDTAWTLRYVKNSIAATDVPERLTSLIRQRRRWLNGPCPGRTRALGPHLTVLPTPGSLFATIYVIANFQQFWRASSHSLLFKARMSILFAFYAASLVLTWFIAGNFYLMFHFAAAPTTVNHASDLVYSVLNILFMYITIIQVVLAMGNKPHQVELMYFLCTIGYAVFFAFTVGMSISAVFQSNGTNQSVDPKGVAGALGSVASYIVAAVLHGELLPVAASMLQYFFMLPTFLISFPIYSFCKGACARACRPLLGH